MICFFHNCQFVCTSNYWLGIHLWHWQWPWKCDCKMSTSPKWQWVAWSKSWNERQTCSHQGGQTSMGDPQLPYSDLPEHIIWSTTLCRWVYLQSRFGPVDLTCTWMRLYLHFASKYTFNYLRMMLIMILFEMGLIWPLNKSSPTSSPQQEDLSLTLSWVHTCKTTG